MSGAIPSLLQYAFMAWGSLKNMFIEIEVEGVFVQLQN
jgi:hypothetical protein